MKVLATTKTRLRKTAFSNVPQEKKTKIIFADFSELDCHRDSESGLIDNKELEMCRYLEHKARAETKF